MSHLREENEYWRTPEFVEFTRKSEYRVLKFLMAHIVRESKDGKAPPGAYKIYRDFFKNGMLCAGYSLKGIADIFGWKSAGHVCDLVNNLARMKLLHIHKVPSPLGEKNIYQFGFYDGNWGEGDYKETLFFDVYFSGMAKIQKARIADRREHESRSNCSPEFLQEINDRLIQLDDERTARMEW